MGSDQHYPEEDHVHRVTVGGFWMDRHTVTNRGFARFVAETRHVTVAEQAPNPADYPGARPEMLVPASTVFFHRPRGWTWATRTTGGLTCRARTGCTRGGRAAP